MKNYEKLGFFYLGKKVGSDEPFLMESKDFTTHAVIVGMTGSGKTGLGIILLEDAGIDGIPAIIIDPKGDMGNLLLTFPNLAEEDFLPWVDEEEAKRKGLTKEELAKSILAATKKGLQDSDEEPSRIKKFKDSVDITIYTPGSNTGIAVSILKSFALPSKELLQDSSALREKVSTLTTSLLSLIGISDDSMTSREHILISTIIEYLWKSGKNLDLPTLIQLIEKPPFEKVGVFDLNTFFPPKDRLELSLKLNSLVASSSFQSWIEGVPLEISSLLYTKEGKPRFAIFSISHLSDKERMFFVTLLLNEIIAWTRRQTGTSSLRALLYMDEIFGYFPPTSNPPSKVPMLTLLKQARAFGLGCILSTQNPVDLDYKGLSNAGTWFIGKLQTERDKLRVIEGLKQASQEGGADVKSIDSELSSIANRTFLVRSVYYAEPITFKTRFTLSYLRGPISQSEISTLMEKSRTAEVKETTEPKPYELKKTGSVTKPLLGSQIQEYFFKSQQSGTHITYKPLIAGFAKVHFTDSKNGVDLWKDLSIVTPPNKDGSDALWGEGSDYKELKDRLEGEPLENSFFETLPANLMQEKTYKLLEKTFASWLYQSYSLPLFKAPSLKLVSKMGESEEEFKGRVNLASREKRDQAVENLRSQYQKKMDQIQTRLQKATSKAENEKSEASLKKAQTYISIGTTILGALLGKKSVSKGTINNAGTSIQKATRMQKQTQEALDAENQVEAYKRELEQLDGELQDEITKLTLHFSDDLIEKTEIKPKKSDISVEKVVLVWWPIFS